MEEKQNKKQYTPEQMQARREAVKRRYEKIDRIAVQLPAGTKDRISRLTGQSCNAYIKEVILADLERLEKYKAK